eukprot:jgi/Galph1/3304/GphlegSOOS_G2001.1
MAFTGVSSALCFGYSRSQGPISGRKVSQNCVCRGVTASVRRTTLGVAYCLFPSMNNCFSTPSILLEAAERKYCGESYWVLNRIPPVTKFSSKRTGIKVNRNRKKVTCKLFSSKSGNQQQNVASITSMSEVEKEKKRMTQRIFELCKRFENLQTQNVVEAACFLDENQRFKLWYQIEELQREKLFEISVYNFERAAELRDEIALLRMRDAYVLLQECVDEALFHGNLALATKFFEAMMQVGEPPNLKKRIPSQGGEIKKENTQLPDCFIPSVMNNNRNVSSLPIDSIETKVSSDRKIGEETCSWKQDFEFAQEQSFVEPGNANLWDNQEMFGDALTESDVYYVKNTNDNDVSRKDQSAQGPCQNVASAKGSSVNQLLYLSSSPSSTVVSSPGSLEEFNAYNGLDLSSNNNSTKEIVEEKRNASFFKLSEPLRQNITVELEGQLNLERSSYAERLLCFEYHIGITNTGHDVIQLLNSSCIIQTTDGHSETLVEKVVSDRKPIVQNGETFEYSSFCLLQQPNVIDRSLCVGSLQNVFILAQGECDQELLHIETTPVDLRIPTEYY